MARSTNEECARLDALNEIEAFVLFHVAYGYDFEMIDRDLAERSNGHGYTVLGTLPSIYEKLQISGITRECDRIRKAGKILIDHRENERERSYAEQGIGRFAVPESMHA